MLNFNSKNRNVTHKFYIVIAVTILIVWHHGWLLCSIPVSRDSVQLLIPYTIFFCSVDFLFLFFNLYGTEFVDSEKLIGGGQSVRSSIFIFYFCTERNLMNSEKLIGGGQSVRSSIPYFCFIQSIIYYRDADVRNTESL